MMGWIGRYTQHAFTRQHWFLAYRSSADPSGQFRFIVSEPWRFLADPFLFREGNKTYLFAEDYRFAERKALISVAELNEKGECGAWRECLVRPYHLSYPCVFAWQDAIYMIPETRSNRTIELYRAEEFPLGWQLEKTLFAEIEASDATVFTASGRWWMFVTIKVEGRDPDDNLHIFLADSPLGPWLPHPKNPVVTGKERSRPAGMVFERAGALIRPAQDCALRYGHRVVFHRIEELSAEEYRETTLGAIGPAWLAGNLGTHTYQLEDGFEAVDARFRVPRGPFAFPMTFRQNPWRFGAPWASK